MNHGVVSGAPSHSHHRPAKDSFIRLRAEILPTWAIGDSYQSLAAQTRRASPPPLPPDTIRWMAIPAGAVTNQNRENAGSKAMAMSSRRILFDFGRDIIVPSGA